MLCKLVIRPGRLAGASVCISVPRVVRNSDCQKAIAVVTTKANAIHLAWANSISTTELAIAAHHYFALGKDEPERRHGKRRQQAANPGNGQQVSAHISVSLQNIRGEHREQKPGRVQDDVGNYRQRHQLEEGTLTAPYVAQALHHVGQRRTPAAARRRAGGGWFWGEDHRHVGQVQDGLDGEVPELAQREDRIPPTSGPTIWASVMVKTLATMALPSIFRGTVPAMRDWRTGWVMERQAPARTTYRWACQTATCPDITNRGKEMDSAAIISCSVMTSRRRSKRSLRTPPQEHTTGPGRVSMPPTVAARRPATFEPPRDRESANPRLAVVSTGHCWRRNCRATATGNCGMLATRPACATGEVPLS